MTTLFATPPPVPQNEVQAAHVKLYSHLRTSHYCRGERDYLEGKLTEFQQLGIAGPDFLERFPLECGARIWEMLLATTMASWNWKLVPPRKLGVGPDFGIQCNDGSVMWVEATVPTPGAECKPDGKKNRDTVRLPLISLEVRLSVGVT